MSDQPRGLPGYWMYETSGVLGPVVEAYLRGDPLDAVQVATIRAYLREWIAAPAWQGPMIDVLRTSVDEIGTRADITRWLDLAVGIGIDPL